MNNWTVHTNLIFLMTIYQLIYDPAIYTIWVCGCDKPAAYPITPDCAKWIVGKTLSYIGGIGSTLMCNILILNVLFIILKGKFLITAVDTKSMIMLQVYIWIPIIVVLALFGQYTSEYFQLSTFIYYVIWSLGAIVNVVFYAIMRYWIHRIMPRTQRGRAPSKNTADRQIYDVVRNLQLYPIVQVVTRLLMNAMGLLSSYNIHEKSKYTIDDDDPRQMYPFSLAAAITESLTSIGFLLIFIILQPNAYNFIRIKWFGLDPIRESNANLSWSGATKNSSFRDSTKTHHKDFGINEVLHERGSYTGNNSTVRGISMSGPVNPMLSFSNRSTSIHRSNPHIETDTSASDTDFVDEHVFSSNDESNGSRASFSLNSMGRDTGSDIGEEVARFSSNRMSCTDTIEGGHFDEEL